MHLTVIVYMRPGPEDNLSARNSNVSGPVMFQSGAVVSSAPVAGSLLLTEMISASTESQLSVAVTVSSSGTILPLGGQSVSELATIPTMTGCSLSSTVTVNPLVVRLPAASV